MSPWNWIYGVLAVFVVGASATLNTHTKAPAPVEPAASPPVPPGATSPAPAQRAVLEAASKDPFASTAPAPPLPMKVPTVQAPVLPPPPPPAPVAPALDLRFTGRMTGPDGKVSVFAQSGNDSVTLTPGLVLPSGYRVDRVTDSAVELTYPPLNTPARFDLPRAPAYEVR